jgi:hypothetical protein
MSKKAKRIIATAALLFWGSALMPATVANELESFRPCGSNEVLYDPSTDDIAMYYGPTGKYIVFPSVGQIRYLGRLRSPDYTFGGTAGTVLADPQWRIEAANKVKELRATARCKTIAGG